MSAPSEFVTNSLRCCSRHSQSEQSNCSMKSALLEMILPELVLAKECVRGPPHNRCLATQSRCAGSLPSPDPVVRLSNSTPWHFQTNNHNDESGQPTFYNHEVIGARVAKQIGQRLRFSKRDCERLFTLVRYHMFHYQPENSDAAIRRFMRKVGLENIDDILDLRESDRLGSGARKLAGDLKKWRSEWLTNSINHLTSLT